VALPPADQDPAGELVMLHVGNVKILIKKTMSGISTELGASSCMIMLITCGSDRASPW